MLNSPKVLAICASLKPALGHNEPSACREILKSATTFVSRSFPHIETLDLRNAALPGFEGLLPSQHYDSAVTDSYKRVCDASGLVFSVPAYWGGVGGTFKTFVEVLCGPSYNDASVSPFAGKPAAAVLIGSDATAAKAGALQLNSVLDAIGVSLVAEIIVLPDPRAPGAVIKVIQELIATMAQLAQDVLKLRKPT